MLIKSVEARVFIHATEDEEKVKSALRNVLGDVNIIEETYEGYYGNKIKIISALINDEKAENILFNIINNISMPDKDEILKSFDERIGKGNSFHIRLNKQKAYLNRLTLSDEDDVIKLIFKFADKQSIEKIKKMIEKSHQVGYKN
ncbi:MAG: RNA-binding domain-containing protein [Caldisphaera sp.]|nr:RNA-binding domain-containing protein [Caldisphaera sp.]